MGWGELWKLPHKVGQTSRPMGLTTWGSGPWGCHMGFSPWTPAAPGSEPSAEVVGRVDQFPILACLPKQQSAGPRRDSGRQLRVCSC